MNDQPLFLLYPPCSTCQKALKWLEANGINAIQRHIVKAPPTVDELRDWIQRSGLPLKRFFNTSGVLYREMKLKDRLPSLSEEQQIALLASDGKLVKRPILVGSDFVLVGFKEEDWLAALGR